MTKSEIQEYVSEVEAMREYQQRYFQTRSNFALKKAKLREATVDRLTQQLKQKLQ